MRVVSILPLLLSSCFIYRGGSSSTKTEETAVPEDTGDETDLTEDTSAPTDLPEPPFVIDHLAPRSAGRINLVAVSGAQPSAEIHIQTEGAPHVALDGCPGLEVDDGSPSVLADAEGTASLMVSVPEVAEITLSAVQVEGCLIT